MNITVPPSPDGRARRAKEEEGIGHGPGFHRRVKSFFSRLQKNKKEKMPNLTGFHQAVGAEVLRKEFSSRQRTMTGPFEKLSRVQGYIPETKQGHHGNFGELRAYREFFAQIALNGASCKCPLTSASFLATSLLLLSGKLYRFHAPLRHLLLPWHLCTCAGVESPAA